MTLPLSNNTLSARENAAADLRADLPRITAPVWNWFGWYTARFVRKHFHALRVSRAGLPELPPDGSAPVIVYLNHPSWWDPLTCLLLARHFFRQRRHYAPIDAAMLSRYRIFSHLGFFGVEKGTRRGATTFLRVGSAIAATPRTCLWITAQGEFADLRDRPVRLAPGLAHLADRVPASTVVLPLAVEYPFWSEREPEVLVRFGPPHARVPGGPSLDAALEVEMDGLASESRSRDPTLFKVLLAGSAGSGPIYDACRWAKAKLTRQHFSRSHMETV